MLRWWVMAAAIVCASTVASADRPLIVGTRPFPPFVIHRQDGTWTGISIDLWTRVARQLGVTYELREGTVAELLAPDDGGFDVIVSLPITAFNERGMDLTHAFYSTGCAIATRVLPGRSVFAPRWWWLGLVAVGLGGAAMLRWLTARPRRHGRTLFHLATMGLVVVIAIGAAAVTRDITSSAPRFAVSGLDDLAHVRVASVVNTVSARYLASHGIASQAFPDLPSALAALDRGDVDAFVNEAPLLQYELSLAAPRDVTMLPGTFHNHGYGFGVRRSRRDLLPAINTAILTIVESDEWRAVLASYSGVARE